MNTKEAEAYILFMMLNKQCEHINYIAVDSNGDVFGYDSVPILQRSAWNSSHAHELCEYLFRMPPPFHYWDKVLISLN